MEKKEGITYRLIGASNHSSYERERADYYATHPIAAELLLQLEPQLEQIWECACGEGHLTKVFDKYGKLALATDIYDYGYDNGIHDFLSGENTYKGYKDIVTNPPYKYALEFVERALELVEDGRYVCMFLRIQFLEGQKRKKFFEENPPVRVWVSSSRISCARSGDFESFPSSALCFAWYVWQKGYKGKTELGWFN